MARPHSIPDRLEVYRAASQALSDALAREYPIGSQWLVHTRSGQRVASLMTVIGHETGWRCHVRFEAEGRPKKFGYGHPKKFRCSVPLERIICRP